MKKNAMKLLLPVLMLLSMTSKTFSQKTVLSSTGDTMVSLTLGQAKFLQMQYYRAQALDSVSRICEAQLATMDSVLADKDQSILRYQLIDRNHKQMEHLKDYQVAKLGEELTKKDREIRRQRNRKRFFAITGTAVAGFFAYLWITK